MNPMKQPVASVLRLIGSLLILLSIALLAFLWLTRLRNPEPWWRWALYVIPAVVGTLVCSFSGRMATRLTRNFAE